MTAQFKEYFYYMPVSPGLLKVTGEICFKECVTISVPLMTII
jgi:hypothetical protein